MTNRQTGIFEVTSREEAAQRGLSRFYTGKTCKHGHNAQRFTSNGVCVTCNKERALETERRRCQDDPAYRMYRNVQRRSGQVLKGNASPVAAIGCDIDKMRTHIEGKLRDGMTWAKYGQWEVDHIVPLSAGNTVKELVRLCHFTNLQPLWKRENITKGGA